MWQCPPVPIDDIRGRIRQAQQIARLRNVPVIPFSATEIEEMQYRLAEGSQEEKHAVWSRVATLPKDIAEDVGQLLATKSESETMSDAVDEAPQPGQQYAQVTAPTPDVPAFRN